MDSGQSGGFPNTVEVESFRYAEPPWERDRDERTTLSVVFFPELENHASGSVSNLSGGNGRSEFPLGAIRDPGPGERLEFPSLNSLSETASSIEDGAPEWAWKSTPGHDSDPVAHPSGEQIFQETLASEIQLAEERGRVRGMEMGLIAGREESARRLESERSRLYDQAAMLIETFSASRGRYFSQMEQESAHLALAIASRILKREVQMDPLSVIGSVRAAIGQLAETTGVRLHVPACDQPLWEKALEQLPGLTIRPLVIGEPGMKPGECRMETELGSADLGIRRQWESIERCFFDAGEGISGSEGYDFRDRDREAVAAAPGSLGQSNGE